MRTLLRLIALLLTLLCLVPALAEEDGQTPALRGWSKQEGYVYLTLGAFPQTKAGERLPILWRVLSVEEDRALLLSEYILEARPIHGDYKEYANKPTNKKKPGFNGDFTQTDMAKYLNGDFTANFTQSELDSLTADETFGLFFLLSSDDLKNTAYGFISNESRKAWGTEYALANGLFKYRAVHHSHSPYWSRTQSSSNTQGARCIKSKGDIGYINVITEDEGMRPVCWLNLSQARIDAGTGTKDDPFTLLTVLGSDEPVITELVPLAPEAAE